MYTLLIKRGVNNNFMKKTVEKLSLIKLCAVPYSTYKLNGSDKVFLNVRMNIYETDIEMCNNWF